MHFSFKPMIPWGDEDNTHKYRALILLLLICIAIQWQTRLSQYWLSTIPVPLVAIFVFWCTVKALPTVAEKLKKSGLHGHDLNKPHSKVRAISKPLIVHFWSRPEGTGIVPSFMYFTGAVLCLPLVIANGWNASTYMAGLLCVILMTFLGFVDDIIQVRWRYKIVWPFVAGLPLILTYDGPTRIITAGFITTMIPVLPPVIWLGYFYHVCLMLSIVFCSNSINIYAGINGLEVGQSIVVAMAQLIYSSLKISSGEHIEANHVSTIFNLIFLATSIGIFLFNKFPSKVFVGDTYTYFAGTNLAVAAILGYSVPFMGLLFLPQIVNFLISCPQLFGYIYCPRHRVPKLSQVTGLLEDSGNLTVLNIMLKLGPLKEEVLVVRLLIMQSIVSAAVLFCYFV